MTYRIKTKSKAKPKDLYQSVCFNPLPPCHEFWNNLNLKKNAMRFSFFQVFFSSVTPSSISTGKTTLACGKCLHRQPQMSNALPGPACIGEFKKSITKCL
jgi:hypothetical protein